MPLHLEPNQKFSITLDSDKDKQPGVRPTFFVRSQSMRGQLEILELLDRLTADEVTVRQLFTETCQLLAKVICGWANMGKFEFMADTASTTLSEFLSYQEARELLKKVAYNQHMEIDQKKD